MTNQRASIRSVIVKMFCLGGVTRYMLPYLPEVPHPPPRALKQSKIKCYFKKMLLNPSGLKSSLRIHARLSLFITSVAIVLKLQSNGCFC